MADGDSGERILNMLVCSDNPREIIYFVKALELLKQAEALPVILRKLSSPVKDHVEDDLVLSISGLLGLNDWFYSHYSLFLRNAAEGISALKSEIEDSPRACHLRQLVDSMELDDFRNLFNRALEGIEADKEVIARALDGPGSGDFKLRYLFTAWLICRQSAADKLS